MKKEQSVFPPFGAKDAYEVGADRTGECAEKELQ